MGEWSGTGSTVKGRRDRAINGWFGVKYVTSKKVLPLQRTVPPSSDGVSVVLGAVLLFGIGSLLAYSGISVTGYPYAVLASGVFTVKDTSVTEWFADEHDKYSESPSLLPSRR